MWRGYRVETLQEFEDACCAALLSNRSAVIDAKITHGRCRIAARLRAV
jgi:thiamine pyrophosphate-dependent acetolactate synthase large subunit-like protein